MSQDYVARIAALEDALRQKDSQLSLVAETESFLRSVLAHARRKIHDVYISTQTATAEEALKRISELYTVE